MFSKKEEDDYLVKLENHINKYGYNDALFGIRMEFSDILYEEHKIGCYLIDGIIIGIQLILVLIGVIGAIFGLHITTITCSFTLILLARILINNAVHDYAWRKAKKRLKKLDEIIEKIKVDTGR